MMRVRPDNFKRLVYFIAALALVSYGIVRALNFLLTLLLIQPPTGIETPSAVGVLVLLYALFDSHLWHWRVFHWLGVVEIPDLRGRWWGTITSSYNTVTTPAALEITQTSSSIVVAVYTGDSESLSQTAEFEVRKADGRPVLRYFFENRPDARAAAGMERHEGTAELVYFEDRQPRQRQLQGSYYTGRSRQTFGRMEFNFEVKKLRGRFM